MNRKLGKEGQDFLRVLQDRIELLRDLVKSSSQNDVEEAAEKLDGGMRLLTGSRKSSTDDRPDDRTVKNSGNILDFDEAETKDLARKTLQDFDDAINEVVEIMRSKVK